MDKVWNRPGAGGGGMKSDGGTVIAPARGVEGEIIKRSGSGDIWDLD